MTATGLLALWRVQMLLWPVREEDRRAIGSLRLNQLCALPGGERNRLLGLVWDRPTTVVGGPMARQGGTKPWRH